MTNHPFVLWMRSEDVNDEYIHLNFLMSCISFL